MTTRILPAVGDADAARSVTTLLSQLPDAEPVAPVTDSTQLVDTLARLAAESVDELPEVVVVHERIGPVPANTSPPAPRCRRTPTDHWATALTRLASSS